MAHLQYDSYTSSAWYINLHEFAVLEEPRFYSEMKTTVGHNNSELQVGVTALISTFQISNLSV